MKAVVLLSGGLDSITAAAIAKNKGFSLHALSFDYGQRHKHELKSAKKVAKFLEVKEHKILKIDLRVFGNSALTSEIAVPKAGKIGKHIPVTYVPARNTIFLSYALAWAEVLECFDIFIGVNSVDYSGYPDCRPEFIKSFTKTANLATKIGVEKNKIVVHTPLMKMKKAEIIKLGLSLGVDYSLTHSCYDPSPIGKICKKCDSCRIRLAGFKEIGLKDPVS